MHSEDVETVGEGENANEEDEQENPDVKEHLYDHSYKGRC